MHDADSSNLNGVASGKRTPKQDNPELTAYVLTRLIRTMLERGIDAQTLAGEIGCTASWISQLRTGESGVGSRGIDQVVAAWGFDDESGLRRAAVQWWVSVGMHVWDVKGDAALERAIEAVKSLASTPEPEMRAIVCCAVGEDWAPFARKSEVFWTDLLGPMTTRIRAPKVERAAAKRHAERDERIERRKWAQKKADNRLDKNQKVAAEAAAKQAEIEAHKERRGRKRKAAQ